MISIIIPTFNQAEFLEDTCNHLIEMSFSDWECLIIDDGSTDNSYEILQKILQIDNRFSYYFQKNSGTAVARNYGLSLAKGEFVQFLDADDYLSNEKLLQQSDLMRKNNLDLSWTGFAFFEGDGRPDMDSIVPEFPKIKGNYYYNLVRRWGVNLTIPIHSFMLRTEWLKLNNIKYEEDLIYREDWDFHLKIARLNPAIGTLNDTVGAYYRRNPKGKTKTYIDILNGNLRFLLFKLHKVSKISDICLIIFRMSEEIVLWGLRIIKYRSLKSLKLLNVFSEYTFSGLIALLMSILIFPFALVAVLLRNR